MRKTLVICAHYPERNPKYAGHRSAFHIIRDMAATGPIDVALVCSEDIDVAQFERDIPNSTVVFSEKLSSLDKSLNIMSSRLRLPLKVASRYSRKLIAFLEAHRGEYDTIHFEFTHAAAVFREAQRWFKDATFTVSCHDILTQGILRSSRHVVQALDAQLTFRFESDLFELCSGILVHNEKDRMLAQCLFSVPDSKLRTVPPPLAEFVHEVAKRRVPTRTKNLLFWGAMNRRENEESILRFWQNNKDFLVQNGYHLYIVGANPTAKVKALSSSCVCVTGFVEDPSEYFLKSSLGVVPLTAGAGIKVKTLEMLASGLPVLSTPIGAEGISDAHLTVAPLDEFRQLIGDFFNEVESAH